MLVKNPKHPLHTKNSLNLKLGFFTESAVFFSKNFAEISRFEPFQGLEK